MTLVKRLARSVSRFFLLRYSVLLLIKIGWVCSRTWSHLRFRALVPGAGDSVCNWTVEIKHPQNLTIGNNVRIGPCASIGAASPITIKDNVVISRGVIIETAGLDLKKDIPYPHISKPIVIERGAWIATNAIILGGVTIGENALIGAGAIVGRDVPPNSIVKPAAVQTHTRFTANSVTAGMAER